MLIIISIHINDLGLRSEGPIDRPPIPLIQQRDDTSKKHRNADISRKTKFKEENQYSVEQTKTNDVDCHSL